MGWPKLYHFHVKDFLQPTSVFKVENPSKIHQSTYLL